MDSWGRGQPPIQENAEETVRQNKAPRMRMEGELGEQGGWVTCYLKG